jgi:membrane-associated phospholipid phosphatase
MTPMRAGVILLGAGVIAACLVPADGAVAQAARALQDGGRFELGGDVRRTLLLLQQFGDAATSVIAGIIVLLQDPAKARRVADWALAAVLTALITHAMKIGFGRPRPRFDDPLGFTFAVQPYALPRGEDGARVELYSWEFWGGVSSDLGSMPSSHTSAAAVLAVVLSRLYPRLTPLCLTLLVIVAAARIVFGAHYPSDVVVGGAVGWVIGSVVMDRGWLSRGLARRQGV